MHACGAIEILGHDHGSRWVEERDDTAVQLRHDAGRPNQSERIEAYGGDSEELIPIIDRLRYDDGRPRAFFIDLHERRERFGNDRGAPLAGEAKVVPSRNVQPHDRTSVVRDGRIRLHNESLGVDESNEVCIAELAPEAFYEKWSFTGVAHQLPGHIGQRILSNR